MMSEHYTIFDRQRVKIHRARALTDSDFLLREMASRLCESLEHMTRGFPLALDLGAHHGVMSEALRGRFGIQTLVQADLSQRQLAQAKGIRVVADEEFLPFAENRFDLVVSAGSMHWINDLPGTLVQIRRMLKPDGLLLAMLPGGATLHELREAMGEAELELRAGVSPRISPFVDVRDAGGLLQRAGFDMPVADSEILTVQYNDPMQLLYDLRAMGETSALMQGEKNMARRALFACAMEIYRKRFPAEEGRVRASFELVTITGWKPR